MFITFVFYKIKYISSHVGWKFVAQWFNYIVLKLMENYNYYIMLLFV